MSLESVQYANNRLLIMFLAFRTTLIRLLQKVYSFNHPSSGVALFKSRYKFVQDEVGANGVHSERVWSGE
jgi:hypothetical protein